MFRGYLSSSFDLLNVEDLDLIAQARERCDVLVLGVYSDELVERLYGRAPVVGLEERMALLRHVRGVADVWVHDDLEPDDLDSARPEGLQPFAVEGRPNDGLSAQRPYWLRSDRRTESVALLRALQPALGDDDAAVA